MSSDGSHPTSDGDSTISIGRQEAAEKVKTFPLTPGVYLFKDAADQVIYVGKAKNLRARASSYFHQAAAVEMRTAHWVQDIHDVDFIPCESEVDALLMESRLIKDIQPPRNKEQKDDKTFPYLQIVTNEDFPRIEITRSPRNKGVKLFGPFASAGSLRGAVQVLQRIFKFRTCALDIDEDDPAWRWFRPCLLASIRQCTAPCNLRITRDEYRRDIKRFIIVLSGKRQHFMAKKRRGMEQHFERFGFEAAAKLRDEITALESLDERGELDTHAQPEVFYVDPKKGLKGLRKVFHLTDEPRTIEGVDIAHLQGRQTVASVVKFIDGLPFRPGYRRYRIRETRGIDDYHSIHEVVARRFQRLADEGDVFPGVLLIDGGKGQLRAALAAFGSLKLNPPLVLSLAKREELVYWAGSDKPLRLSRHSFTLRLLQYVRDEAHRFAQHYHHLLRDDDQLNG